MRMERKKFEQIKYVERKTGEIKIEKVMGEKALKYLYYCPVGKYFLSIIKKKFISDWYGRKMSNPKSKKKIVSFINEMSIDMKESKKKIEEFKTFNDFFCRELKNGTRPIASEENILTSPADSKVLAFVDIEKKDNFLIKGSEFNLEEFFDDKILAEKYKGGTFVIFRLAPADYHRFHFPVDGKVGENRKITGDYYSVSTHAIRKNFRIFCENKREYSIISTENFGKVAMFEVGATMVGGIVQTFQENSYVRKGDEKGYFLFGGSTCILVFEKDKIQIDDDILKNTKNKIETKIYMGERFANKK